MAAEGGFPPNSSSRRDRRAHYHVDFAVAGTGCLRGAVRATHLPQDLALAQNLGVETGGYTEEMPHRIGPVEPHDCGGEIDTSGPGEVAEPWFDVVHARPVDLEPVAG
jgi:hypothetical protein